MMPVLPFINDTVENMREIVRLSAEHGARFVYPWFGLTLRDSQRAYFYEKLDERFPGTRAKYEARYGNAYRCDSPDAKRLYAAFKEECAKAGLLHDMRDIVSGYKSGYETTQFSFFD
jgi:DNA repair photolyase